LATGQSVAANITAAPLTATITAPNKVYDGTTTATPTFTVTAGLVGTETVTATGTATFNSKDVLSANLVTANSNVLADGSNGGLAGNYSLATGQSVAANITAAPLSVTANEVTKTYDGTTLAAGTATIGSIAGIGDSMLDAGIQTFIDKNFGIGNKTVRASGVTIQDSGNVDVTNNYTITFIDNTTSTINKALLNVTASAAIKTYDGTLSAPGIASIDVIAGAGAGESVLNAGSQTFLDRNFGIANKTVRASGVSIQDSGNADVSGNYTIAYIDNTAGTINKAIVTLTAPIVTKTYDGTLTYTTTATDLTALSSPLITGDSVAAATLSFTDKNAGAGNKSITLDEATINDGNNGANYNVTLAGNSSSTITPASLTASVAAPGKVYDGTTTATPTLTITSGLIGTETITANGTATFNSKDVATANLVTVNSTTLADGINGGLASNYTLPSGQTVFASITPAPLTISANDFTKTYDGIPFSGGNGVTYNTLVNGETAAVLGGSLTYNGTSQGAVNSSSVPGQYMIMPGGLTSSNYAISFVEGQLFIQRAILSVNLTGQRAYDGTTNVDAGIFTLSGLILGESLTLNGIGTIADKNVGNNKTVSFGTLALADSPTGLALNYTLSGGTQTVDITPAPLTLSATGINKEYDGLVNAAVTLADNRVTGDVLTIGTGTATFTDKNVGTAKTINVNGLTISGTDAGNYTFNSSTATTADITPKSLTVSGITAANKVYDATSTATINVAGVTYAGLISGDVVTLNSTGTFSDKNVANAKIVSLVNNYTGADVGNYSITEQTSTTADITAKILNITANGIDKVYDGLDDAAVTYVDDRVAGDIISITGSAFFSDKNVGIAKTVTVSGISLSGTDFINYSFNTNISTTANITAKALTATLAVPDKVYDGTTDATPTLTINSGLVGIETIIASGTATFNSPDVTTANLVTLDTVSLADGSNGGLSGNYTLSTGQTITAHITPAALTASVSAPDKVYDGSDSATSTLTITGGLIGTETVTVTGTATFNSKDVFAANLVTVNSTLIEDGLNNGLASNYSLAPGQTTSANITPATLSITATGIDKTFDGLTNASVNFADDRKPNDVFTISGNAQFTDPYAGENKTVNVSSIALQGADAGNYTFNNATSTMANIIFVDFPVTTISLPNVQAIAVGQAQNMIQIPAVDIPRIELNKSVILVDSALNLPSNMLHIETNVTQRSDEQNNTDETAKPVKSSRFQFD
ncbi:MAG: YDG domain-containing protein, partial [Gallionellaceae bacterium]